MSILSVRIDKEIEEKIKLLLEMRKIQDKSSYIRKLLSKALQEDLIDDYCKQVQKGQITLWKAAELSGLSLRQMMDEVGKRNIILYDEKALENDLRFAIQE